MGESHSVDYSEEFYKRHSQRYSEVSHQLLQSVYGWPSHPALKTDMNLLEWLRAFETAKNELDPSDIVIAVLAGDWRELEIALNSEKHEGYVPPWQIPDADQVAELGRYHGHKILRGPTDSDLRMYLVELKSWGCFVRAQCKGDQDLRIDVSTISVERAREILNENPNHFPTEPDEESKLRKLQTCVELEIYARIEFRIKNPSRALRVVQSEVSTPSASPWRTKLLAIPVSKTERDRVTP